jgi:hypothetical protein
MGIHLRLLEENANERNRRMQVKSLHWGRRMRKSLVKVKTLTFISSSHLHSHLAGVKVRQCQMVRPNLRILVTRADQPLSPQLTITLMIDSGIRRPTGLVPTDFLSKSDHFPPMNQQLKCRAVGPNYFLYDKLR